MPMFTKKPVTIEARQFHPLPAIEADIISWMSDDIARVEREGGAGTRLVIRTLEGVLRADPGDWIIRGVKGEFYPCKPDIFAATYDAAGADPVDADSSWRTACRTALARTRSVRGDTVRHVKRGSTYTVVGAAVREDDVSCDAVYMDTDGAMITRNWNRFTDGRFEKLTSGAGRAVLEFDLVGHLHRQSAWSEKTFGPGERTAGVVDHIRKELSEIEGNPDDVTEWIDVVLLAFDGAWRTGHSPESIVAALVAKQAKNEARDWPDWRTVPHGKAVEHIKSPA